MTGADLSSQPHGAWNQGPENAVASCRRGPGTVDEGRPRRGGLEAHLALPRGSRDGIPEPVSGSVTSQLVTGHGVPHARDGACGDRGRTMGRYGDPGAGLALVVVARWRRGGGRGGTAGPSLLWLAPRRVFAAKNHRIQGRVSGIGWGQRQRQPQRQPMPNEEGCNSDSGKTGAYHP